MPHAVAPPEAGRLPQDRVAGFAAVITVLTVTAAVVGSRRWPLPERVAGGWGVTAVPASLGALLGAVTALSLGAATVLTFRVTRLRPAMPAGLAWLAVVGLATAVLGWHVLVMAANGGREDFGPYLPVVDGVVTAGPALLAGGITARRGAVVAALSALGTGVATLPLYALAVALLGSRDPFAGGPWQPLWAAVAFGAVPLALAVIVSRTWGQHQERRSAAHR